jgi:hypothetical protein
LTCATDCSMHIWGGGYMYIWGGVHMYTPEELLDVRH